VRRAIVRYDRSRTILLGEQLESNRIGAGIEAQRVASLREYLCREQQG
jgi:hypothetical protein